MPDRWGRVTGNDWMQFANGLNTINAMGQRNTFLNQQQADRTEAQQYKANINTNAMGYMAGDQPKPHGDGKIYDAPGAMQPFKGVGTVKSQVEGKKLASQSLTADLNIKNQKQAQEVTDKGAAMIAWIDEDPENRNIENVPIEMKKGISGRKAYIGIVGLTGQLAQNRKIIMTNRAPVLKQAAKDFQNSQIAIQEAEKTGDINRVVMELQHFSEKLPIGYKLGEFNPEDQTFQVEYNNRDSDGYQKTGIQTLQEVMAKVKNTGTEKMLAQLNLGMDAKVAENLKNAANPYYGKTKEGIKTHITSAPKILDLAGGYTITVENAETGEPVGQYDSWATFRKAGNTKEDIKRDTALLNQDKIKQQTNTAKAAMDSHDASRKLATARTNALGDTKKFGKRKLFDKRGNEVTAENQSTYNHYIGLGYSEENPNVSKDVVEQYERNSKAFAVQTSEFGVTTDEETGNVSGVVKRGDDMTKVLKIANEMGLELYSEQDRKIDQGWIERWFKSGEMAAKITVLPYDSESVVQKTDQDNNDKIVVQKTDQDNNDKIVGQFDIGENVEKPSPENNDSNTAAMGKGSNRAQFSSQLNNLKINKINRNDKTTVLKDLIKEGVKGVTTTDKKWKGKPIGIKNGKPMIYEGGKWRYMRRAERREYKG